MEQNKFITQACTHISSYYVSQHQKELSNANAFIHNANVNTAGRQQQLDSRDQKATDTNTQLYVARHQKYEVNMLAQQLL